MPASIMSDIAESRIPCIGCGALVPQQDGPTHRYMESSPGCWAIYCEVLAQEYSDIAFATAHRLTVDAYAVQHPGTPSPQSIQSIGVHLAPALSDSRVRFHGRSGSEGNANLVPPKSFVPLAGSAGITRRQDRFACVESQRRGGTHASCLGLGALGMGRLDAAS